MTNERDATLPRAWVVWAVGLLVYGLAVFHRSSLGVAGLVAADRFGISASQLATFTMLQLLVYAGMQVPVGLLCDRFGSRSVLLVGTTLIALAQAGFAFPHTYVTALVARGFVGVGDAMTFVCVLRLVNSWFPLAADPAGHPADRHLRPARRGGGRRADDLGAGPPGLDPRLPDGGRRQPGLPWSACWPCSTTHPTSRHLRGPRMSAAAVRRSLRASWAQPGTRLGFWMHFTTQFSATTTAPALGLPVPGPR